MKHEKVVSSSMRIHDVNVPNAVSYQCPICGQALPYHPSLPRFDAPCSGCGYHLWGRRLLASNDELVVEVLPGRTPQPADVEQFVESLARARATVRVIIDLSRLDSIDSCLTARLVSLSKSLQSLGGQLVLRNLRPTVREILEHFRLDKVLRIVN
jgi:anti-anti-sigma factor